MLSRLLGYLLIFGFGGAAWWFFLMSKLERIQDLHHQLYNGLRDYANHWPLEKVKFMEEDCFEKYKNELVTERSKQAFFRKEETKRMENFMKIPNIMETSIKILEYTKKTQEKMRNAQDRLLITRLYHKI